METEKPSGTNKQGEREIVQLLFRITSFYLAIYCIYGITQNSLYYPRFFSGILPSNMVSIDWCFNLEPVAGVYHCLSRNVCLLNWFDWSYQ